MKKIVYAAALLASLYSCKTTQNLSSKDQPIITTIDLVNVTDDKVKVSVDPAKITTEEISFFIPKTVPGTYSTDNYGRFIENFKAYDYDGNELTFTHQDDNTWTISNAKALDKVSYEVNDSYDIEGENDVFSPAGTNIDADKNFMLNLHGFVGYFSKLQEEPYRIEILRPDNLIAGTSLTPTTKDENPDDNFSTDTYTVGRYFEVTDHPIMYAKPDTTSFDVQGMKVLLDVYSPTGKFSAQDIKPGIEKMISAQKKFLGDINDTEKYAILLYLSDLQKKDARGFGALEHHTSTTVVLPETMQKAQLDESMKDVVSHEFFHIVTPLSVHSNEIHYFDYNDPKMSQHLWMYEGVTEYFANLFQINQGLISNQDFYDRMSEKIASSMNFDDTVPFTVMSENILTDQYKDSYYNVYQKGALIGMALDIRLRELSDGKIGILDLMKKLSKKYGKDKPFNDEDLIGDIVALTYPEIQSFFDQYVTGETPIPYNEFFAKVGLEEKSSMINTGYFLNGQVPYIDGDPVSGELFFRKGIGFNTFLEKLGVEGGDIIKTVNGTEYTIKNVYGLITSSQSWEEGSDIEIVVDRDGEEITLTAKASQPQVEETSITEMELPADSPKVKLREAWLKN
ncbi:MAG: peptidase M61 [Zunongwangia sp.]|uniref:M61 family metallopeptidase n=2 Tax=Zunongwangia profunda TaxID=398743 RepID=UPI000C607576|nr:peptidase M61 [Zunongwangia profunda]MAO34496.1 peptidase M61 [Zunongwangia sp.]MAS71475.1 peptidase M61 [Zunongwangia sp.]|tara:strand:- start:727 stop:2598 length:1872 start_codon:yes stop_codon:yes gene_type:complete